MAEREMQLIFPIRQNKEEFKMEYMVCRNCVEVYLEADDGIYCPQCQRRLETTALSQLNRQYLEKIIKKLNDRSNYFMDLHINEAERTSNARRNRFEELYSGGYRGDRLQRMLDSLYPYDNHWVRKSDEIAKERDAAKKMLRNLP